MRVSIFARSFLTVALAAFAATAESLPVPHLVAPICAGQETVLVQMATENAALALHRNNSTSSIGYVGVAAEDASIDFVGVNSTPVINAETETMYVMARTSVSSSADPVYHLHAIDLRTLTDRVAPVTVSDKPGGPAGIDFSSTNQRQRSALLLSGNKVYAAFTSFCDGYKARDWVRGWNASTLAELPNAFVANRISTVSDPPLSGIWMSGSGHEPAG
jgi:hypothetical protein